MFATDSQKFFGESILPQPQNSQNFLLFSQQSKPRQALRSEYSSTDMQIVAFIKFRVGSSLTEGRKPSFLFRWEHACRSVEHSDQSTQSSYCDAFRIEPAGSLSISLLPHQRIGRVGSLPKSIGSNEYQ